jgi:hypothetical protein
MAALTSSSSATAPRSNPAAALSLLAGVLGVAALPASVAASRYVPSVRLLDALYAGVPAAIVLGLLAVAAARRARRRHVLSLGRTRGEAVARAGRILALLGVYIGCTGGLALAFYGVLRAYS